MQSFFAGAEPGRSGLHRLPGAHTPAHAHARTHSPALALRVFPHPARGAPLAASVCPAAKHTHTHR